MKCELRLGYIELISECPLDNDVLNSFADKPLKLTFKGYIVPGSLYSYKIEVVKKGGD